MQVRMVRRLQLSVLFTAAFVVLMSVLPSREITNDLLRSHKSPIIQSKSITTNSSSSSSSSSSIDTIVETLNTNVSTTNVSSSIVAADTLSHSEDGIVAVDALSHTKDEEKEENHVDDREKDDDDDDDDDNDEIEAISDTEDEMEEGGVIKEAEGPPHVPTVIIAGAQKGVSQRYTYK